MSCLSILIFACTARGVPPSFHGLGHLDGANPRGDVRAISADGRTVVGWTQTEEINQQAFRWSLNSGLVGLGYLPGTQHLSAAADVSQDGTVIIGWSRTDTSSQAAFRWTIQTGMVELASAEVTSIAAVGISADGSKIVGGFGNGLAYWWTINDGWSPLPPGIGGPYGISDDGMYVFGAASTTGSQNCTAFRWGQTTGLTCLPQPPNGDCCINPYAVSGDGRVVVGSTHNVDTNVTSAFVWSDTNGMIPIGTLTGYTASAALDISLDGMVVVGTAWGAVLGDEAFIWDAVHGMRSLRGVLTNEYGLNLSGWSGIWATAVSANGLTIAGSATNSNGEFEPWIAQLPPPPCPADLNCDGALNLFDIGPFVLALTDTRLYATTFPLCGWARADVNVDGGVDGADVQPFVAALLAGPCP